MSNVSYGEEDPGVGGEVENGSEADEEDTGHAEGVLRQPLFPGDTVSEALSDGVFVQEVILQFFLPPSLELTDMAGEAVGEGLGHLMESHIFLGQLPPGQHPQTDCQ